MTTNKGWIGVDFDGTLAHYHEWRGPLEFGEPIAPMVQRVMHWLREGYEVRVFTARVTEHPDNPVDEIIDAIQDWTEYHIGVRLPVTNKKDFDMIEAWDDRAIHVHPNSGIGVGYSRVENRFIYD